MKKILYGLLLFLGLLLVPKEVEAATLSEANGVLKIDMGSDTSLTNVIKGSEYYKNNAYSGPTNINVISSGNIAVVDLPICHINLSLKGNIITVGLMQRQVESNIQVRKF